jgi:2,5-dioxopentanoate dehydrogenase
VARLRQLGSLEASLPAATPDASRTQASAYLFSTDAAVFLEQRVLGEEVFGPTTLVVACESKERLRQVAENLEGSLTATIHGTPDDLREFAWLVRVLENKAGRLIVG